MVHLHQPQRLQLGTGDTIFFSVPGGPERIDLLLRGLTSGTDFDIYVRSGSLPEKNIYNQRSVDGGSDELITINGDTSGQTHYIAVTSPTETVKAQVKTKLREAAKRFYGMTEGQIEMKSATLYPVPGWFGTCSCDGGCDICVSSAEGRAHSGMPGEATIYANEWDPAHPESWLGGWIIVHELGHGQLALDDEYSDHGTSTGLCHGDELCGHTMMAGFDSSNLCIAFSHKTNTKPIGHVCWGGSNPTATCSDGCANDLYGDDASAWDYLEASGRIVSKPSTTPENGTYTNFAPLDRKFTSYEDVP